MSIQNEQQSVNGAKYKKKLYPGQISIILVDRQKSPVQILTNTGNPLKRNRSGESHTLSDVLPKGMTNTILEDIENAFESLSTVERDISQNDGLRFTVRIAPCQNVSGRVENVTVSLYESTKQNIIEAELAEKVKEISELKRQILLNDINDRWRVGTFLHDELSQLLFVADLMINDLYYDFMNESIDIAEKSKIISKKFGEISKILKQAGEGTRNLSHDILPVKIKTNKIVPAFENLFKRTEKYHNMTCKVEGIEILNTINDTILATNLFHITNEAIKNAVKHTNSDTINIKLKSYKKLLYLAIKDNGEHVSDTSEIEGLGIDIMKYRAEMMGGSLKVTHLPESDNFRTCVKCIVNKDYTVSEK